MPEAEVFHDLTTAVSNYIAEGMVVHNTYFRPHKTAQLRGYYIPSIKREEIDIGVGIDTSGSISDTEYTEFLTELSALDRLYKGRIKFTILTCDAEVHTVDQFDHGFDVRKLKGRGYGGTAFKPVFEWFKDKRHKTKLLVYFTDLFGDQDSLQKKDYKFQTLWVISENGNKDDPPFGYIVRLTPKSAKYK